ncbi:MAG: M28 family peptidase [Clostridia bacterium]|nr:M28 family peptidase [Clostridia bacterium]
MKRVLGLILLFTVLAALFLSVPVASADTAVPYDLAVSYCAMHSRRDILSGGEAAAARTLADRLSARGYTVTTPTDRQVGENDEGKTQSYELTHVIGFKDNGKGRTLLIGTFYGGYEPTDSLGVGDGASAALSVGALLYVADALVSLPLDYDIAIAFWGGIELGTEVNVEKCGLDLSSIALYINFDCIAAGRSDYLYADDLPRAQETYFREIASEQGATFEAAPTYKRPSALSMGEGAYSYLHLGLLGANLSFMNEDIPCVNFTSGAWDYDSGLYRYPGKGDIEGTSLDTIEEIDRLNGGKEATSSRLLAATKVVIAGVKDRRLSAVLDEAAKETSGADLNSDLAYYLISFIGIAALLAFFIFLILRQGKDRRDVVWEPAKSSDRSADPFEELRSDDARDAGDPPSDSDDDGDVFRF